MGIGKNIVIAGFSGTGKSQVAREVAQRLNWSFIDTDDEIARRAGKPVADIFKRDGEGRFRDLERQMIREVSLQKQVVIAVGGGTIVDTQNYELLARCGIIVCLEAKVETIYQRLFEGEAYSTETEVRPLLVDENPLNRISQLKASRQPSYANVDWTIHTDTLNLNQVADEVMRSWKLLSQGAFSQACDDMEKDIACRVETPRQAYPVFVGYSLLDKLGMKMKEASLSGTALIVSDENVFSFYGSRVAGALKEAGFNVVSFVVSPGETGKSMNSAIAVYDFMVKHHIERGDVIVALGGGVVGDLAGFVAATFLRGISWVQVPTSLVAMVDASIGGKVGVNHPQGKNLIGSFYQPRLVLADCQTLATLPQREFTSGWAEVIKHGLILDKDFFEFLDANVDRLRMADSDMLARAVSDSAAIKAQIVSEDERETGQRMLLNYGHTIAHGLEAATQYKRFLHGEAVSIGMVGASLISQRLGLLPPNAAKQQQLLLERFGLPVGFSGVDLNRVMSAMALDKKMQGRVMRWVLLHDTGKAVICNNVPRQIVLDVLQELNAA